MRLLFFYSICRYGPIWEPLFLPFTVASIHESELALSLAQDLA